MKKEIIYSIPFFLFLQLRVAAQKDSLIESLKLNSSPAYIVLGVDPENIQRPSSPTQFISGLQNSIVNKKLKPNIAFEFSPYYWKKPKGNDSIRFRPIEYLLPQKSLWKNIGKNSSFSIATSESDTVIFGKLKPGTGLAIGLRSVLIEGKPDSKKVQLLQQWNEVFLKENILNDIIAMLGSLDSIKMLSNSVNDVISAWKIKLTDSVSKYPQLSFGFANAFLDDLANTLLKEYNFSNSASPVSISAYLEQRYSIYKTEEADLLKKINKDKLPFTKTGFMLEFALGEAVIFQNNAWDSLAQAKAAIWLTPSYRWELKTTDNDSYTLIDLLGVLRYSFNNKKDSVDISDYFDAGLKTQIIHNKISFSIEGVFRYATKKSEQFKRKYTYRLISSFDYKISDLITFKFSFGTNFNGNTSTFTHPKDMFALGGVNFGLFNPAKKNQN